MLRRCAEVTADEHAGLEVAGLVGLVLVLLGAHLAWEHHRGRLWTAKGTIRVGMAAEEVADVLGPSDSIEGLYFRMKRISRGSRLKPHWSEV
jgi:hypothetical protein